MNGLLFDVELSVFLGFVSLFCCLRVCDDLMHKSRPICVMKMDRVRLWLLLFDPLQCAGHAHKKLSSNLSPVAIAALFSDPIKVGHFQRHSSLKLFSFAPFRLLFGYYFVLFSYFFLTRLFALLLCFFICIYLNSEKVL